MVLTDEQLAAATSDENRCIVIAGAGSGKTLLLTERVRHFTSQGVAPSSIMAITFTRRAAQELRDRLTFAPGVHVGTFHSLCLREMDRHGVDRNLLTDTQADALLDSCAISLGLAVQGYDGVEYLRKNRNHYRQQISAARERIGGSPIADAYLSQLLLNGDIDYEGVLYEGLKLARGDGFRDIEHLILDEAQDTSELQWRIVQAIGAHSTITAVGDIAQNLFSFAGADPAYFSSLPWKRYELTKTFRCPQNIADVANRIPEKGVMLESEKADGDFQLIEGDAVERTVGNLIDAGLRADEIAVLCRYNKQVDEYKRRLQGKCQISQPKTSFRGPIYHLLKYIANPGSGSARRDVVWEGDNLPRVVRWAMSEDLDDRSAAMMTKHWCRELGTRWGVEEVLDNIEIPVSMQDEADHYRQLYGGDVIAQFAADESDQAGETSPGLTVSTIHKAKGGEWQAVILPQVESIRDTDTDWRVLYVGVTRSMDKLFVMHMDELGFLQEVFGNGTEGR